ncbi:MAG: hypothetical protein ACE5GI_06945 [Candidatus Aminicenantales bacterium]
MYSDKLVKITDDYILLKWYYFFFIPKKIKFSEIEKIAVKEASLFNGAWRIYGSRDLTIWYPVDFLRPRRDRIFIMKIKNKMMKIGFTVEDSGKVINILRNKCLVEFNHV